MPRTTTDHLITSRIENKKRLDCQPCASWLHSHRHIRRAGQAAVLWRSPQQLRLLGAKVYSTRENELWARRTQFGSEVPSTLIPQNELIHGEVLTVKTYRQECRECVWVVWQLAERRPRAVAGSSTKIENEEKLLDVGMTSKGRHAVLANFQPHAARTPDINRCGVALTETNHNE